MDDELNSTQTVTFQGIHSEQIQRIFYGTYKDSNLQRFNNNR